MCQIVYQFRGEHINLSHSQENSVCLGSSSFLNYQNTFPFLTEDNTMTRITLTFCMLVILLLFSQSTHLTPVRTIVDADYQSESDYLGKISSQPNKKMKPKPKKQRGERRSYEEKLRVDRERKRQSYLTNPEYHKNLNRKTYLKRKLDPVKMANDAKKREIYKAEHRGKIASRQRQYYLNRKAKEQQEKMQGAGNIKPGNESELQKKRKVLKEGKESYHDSISPIKQKASTKVTQTSTRQPIIARLKLSSETINTFYGRKSSPPS